MGVHEVTVGQFRKFVEAENYLTEAERDGKGGGGYDYKTNKFFKNPKYSWRNPGFEQDDKHPVVNVSWNDAVAFCKWLSRIEKRDYRLPTEAHWEYACRAGSSREFTFGDDAAQLVNFANVADASFKTKVPTHLTVQGNDDSLFTSHCGRYQSNELGLHDMHGNVYEWCSDWLGNYPNSAVVDPLGPTIGTHRVLRGGSYCDVGAHCRSAIRRSAPPEGRDSYIGFRLSLSSSEFLKSPTADK